MKKNYRKWYRIEERKNIMKKLIGMVFISLMFANIGFAEMTLIEEKRIKAKEFNYYVATICVDGYKFVVTAAMGGRSMVQFMRQAGWINDPEKNRKPVPAKC